MIILFLLGTGNDCYAQWSESDFIHLTSIQGLSDNSITSIAQDERGYIWIGTYDGLNRYDGHVFKKYLHTDDPSSIPHSTIFRLKYLGEDRLAIITFHGIQILNTRSGRSTNYYVPDTTSFSVDVNKFWDVIELKGKGYLTSTITGYYLFDYSGHLLWRYDQHTAHDAGTTMRFGREMYAMPDGKIFCYYGDFGFAKLFDPLSRELKEIEPENLLFKSYKPMLHHEGGSRISHRNNHFLFTTPGYEGIRAYDLIAQKYTISPVPIVARADFGWPGFLHRINDSTAVQAGGSGGFFILHINANDEVTCDGLRHFGDHKCNALMVDKNNRWWIGTNNGLFQESLIPKSIHKHNVRSFIEKYALTSPVNNVLPVEGRLYFSAGVKDGVSVIDDSTFSLLDQIRLQHQQPEWNDVFAISLFNQDTLWIGTRMGLEYYSIPASTSGIIPIPSGTKGSTTIHEFFYDSHQNIWMGVIGNMTGVLLYTRSTRTFRLYTSTDSTHYFPLEYGTHFTEDNQGNIWVGNKGITRFNYAQMKFDTLITVFAGFQKYEQNINALSADKAGNLWLSTSANGLLSFSIAQRKFTHYSTADHLSSDVISEISQPIDNHLYIGTRSHIDVFDLTSKHVQVLDQEDGLPLDPISSAFSYDRLHHILWAGYGDEIAAIPTQLDSINYPTPKILIEYIEVPLDTILSYPDSMIQLNYRQNNLNVNFTWMEFDPFNHVRTYYRLNNSGSWVDLNQSRTITLGNLPPGTYALDIKINSTIGRWPDQLRSMVIRIKPPYWKTIWFLVLITTLMLSLFYFLYRKNIQRIKAKANIDKLLADYEMKALHSQMNPHFIFNCLNSIKEMILFGEKDKAGFYLSRFAQLIRDTLDHSKRSFITLEQLIDYLSRYIEMEKIRFVDFTYCIHIAPDLHPREIKMPPMLIQPLIENAIWHGLSTQTGAKELEVAFLKQGENIVCRIIDNGIGLNESMKQKKDDHDSTGIENIQKRIALLNQKYHMSSSLTLKDRSDMSPGEKGTIVELSIFLDPE